MAGAENDEHVTREYQVELLELAKEKNIIVCLGTGTGKTFISIKLIEHLAERDDIRRPFSEGAQRTFFLVNSVPLVFQQAEAIERHTSLKVKAFCGEMGVDFWSPEDWMKHFDENHVLVMTHQIYLDLLQKARIKLSRANLLVFDECHHANKNHPFKKIMDRFADFPKDDHPHILGLTASVVGKKVKPHNIPSEVKSLENTLRCVCETASDPRVVEKYGAKPSEILKSYSFKHPDNVAQYFEGQFCSVLGELHKFLQNVKVRKEEGGVEETIEKQLTVAKAAIRECQAALDEIGVWAAYEVAKLIVGDLEKRKKKVLGSLSACANLASLFLEVTLTSLREICGIYYEFKVANQCELEVKQELLKPKVKKLLELFRRTDDNTSNLCSIIFVERRYAACVLSNLINQLSKCDKEFSHLKSDFVTGHGVDPKGISETDMKFNEQKRKLGDFRNGKFNVLVGTSVVEEGVDIPKCNLVVMFDFPKNYRGYVQSRGRGRAKDAHYVLLVSENERMEKSQEQEMYQSVDEYLKTLCRRNRPQPTDEEANDAVNVDLLDPYHTNRNAKLDMHSSICLLYSYCSKLPCDRFTHLKPKFTIHDDRGEFQANLLMPRNSHLTHLIKGEPMPSKKEAKMAVAFEACKQLHKMGGLNDNLRPVDSSSDSESEDLDETDGPKTGTKKRRRYHAVKVPKQLKGEIKCNEEVYVYAIKMKVVDVFKSKKANTKKELWDRKERLFGFVTKNSLPQLPNFFLFNGIGKVEIKIEHCFTLDALKTKQLRLINWFHEFIFTEELKFSGSSTSTGCRVVLLSFSNSSCQPESTKRPYSPTEITEINFEDMKRLKKKVESCDGKITRDTDLNDAMVIAMYRENKARHLVTAVDHHSNPLSDFRKPSKGKTFEDYYKKRYDENIMDNSQPLIQVVHFSRKIDCRSTKAASDQSLKYDEVRLVPELCTLIKCPQSVSLRANLLPSVFYRLQSLLGMLELRNTISAETGIGSSSCMNGHEESWLNEGLSESPNKKSKLSFFSDAMNCYSSRDQGDSFRDSARPPREMTMNLDRYFFPFNSSRSVPLFKLLEAFTCASSSDAFDLERLEMLGDSFLKMAVTIYAYCHMNHKDEGKLTKYRSSQIGNKNLFNLAMKKGLPGYVKHDVFPPRKDEHAKGDEKCEDDDGGDGGGDGGDGDVDDDDGDTTQLIPDKSVADSVEALIGAHFIECGYMTALKFMEWLGLKVLAEEEEKTFDLNSAHYANYRNYICKIPQDDDEGMYREVLKRQTKEMASFEKKIGYDFKNKELLLEAFTHPSYSDNIITGSYQRLEFLGDAVLDFLVTLHIYDHCSDKLTPGKLTDLRSALVNNHTFASVAVDNGYHKYCKEYSPELFSTIGAFVKALEEYQKETGNKVSPNPFVTGVANETNRFECIEAPKPLGDLFESVAGAIFVDSGFDVRTVWKVCYRMLERHIDTYLARVPVDPVRAVMEFDSGAVFSKAEETEEGKISCILIFTEERAKKIGGQRNFTGVGRNKKNAKLSAASTAQKKIEQLESELKIFL